MCILKDIYNHKAKADKIKNKNKDKNKEDEPILQN